jgi:dihydroorotate dehydrogenase (NAD+) catalytic subunit
MPTDSLPRYDYTRTYRWNFDRAPEPPSEIEMPEMQGKWTFCGRTVRSPIGIAAGPLLNGRWVLYYAALGFDVLTYKTTRSVARDCYALPNLQPVISGSLATAGRVLETTNDMQGSWAVSFGMPSMSPDVWRADVEWTRSRLAKDKLLSVSVVASPEPDWSLAELAADFARCARWAVESGADCVETNFSCPNVSTSDSQLYQQPEAAGCVAGCVREAVGNIPYVIKIGLLTDEALAEELLAAVSPFANALSMTNCISATVKRATGDELFAGQPRGIGGEAIRSASIEQVRRFAKVIRERHYALRLIGVGGISTAEHVRHYLSAGAEAVHLGTAAMCDPLVAVHIRRTLEVESTVQ